MIRIGIINDNDGNPISIRYSCCNKMLDFPNIDESNIQESNHRVSPKNLRAPSPKSLMGVEPKDPLNTVSQPFAMTSIMSLYGFPSGYKFQYSISTQFVRLLQIN